MNTTSKYNLPVLSSEGGLSAYLAQIKISNAWCREICLQKWKATGNLKSAEKLVTSHLRLVAKIAMGYKGYGLPVNEMISEETLDLCRL